MSDTDDFNARLVEEQQRQFTKYEHAFECARQAEAVGCATAALKRVTGRFLSEEARASLTQIRQQLSLLYGTIIREGFEERLKSGPE